MSGGRPRLLFVRPGDRSVDDAERLEELTSDWFYAFSEAGWESECYSEDEDVVAIARSWKPKLVIIPPHVVIADLASKLRELEPRPTVLIAALASTTDAAARVRELNADGVFAYRYKNNVVSDARLWLEGGGPKPAGAE